MRNSQRCSRRFPWPSLESSTDGCSWGSVLREPGGFSKLPQLRPPSRNVKLTLFPPARPYSAWCHEQLAGMVRYGQWSWRREQLLSTSIVSWAQNRERADGDSGVHPQQGCSCSEPPLPGPSTALQQGPIVTLLWPSTVRQPNVEKPLQATSDGSVSWAQKCSISSHASSLRTVFVLCRSPA
jgi:hypothetical protein